MPWNYNYEYNYNSKYYFFFEDAVETFFYRGEKMEVNYQKTTELNMDILSFKRYSGVIFFLIRPKRALILLAKIFIKILFGKLDELSNLIKENQDIFPYEYYDCLEINYMIKYTLKRDTSLITPEDLNFIDDMHHSFFELILFKLNLLKENNCEIDETFYEKFNPKYDSFNDDLIKFKEYFYSNIYQESFDENDVVDYLKVAWE